MRRQRLVRALGIGAMVAGATSAVHCRPPVAATSSASAPANAADAANTANASGTPATAARGAAPVSSPAAATPARSSGSPAAPGNAAAAELPPAPRFVSTVYAVKNDPALRACTAPSRGSERASERATVHAIETDLVANVTATGAACAKGTPMKPAKAVTGDQTDAQPPQSFAFRAQGNHCYRIYARAGAGLRDFTLALRDSAGAAIDVHTERAEPADESEGAPRAAKGAGLSVALPEDGAVCFHADDAASVVFSAGGGAGAFALQIWGD